MTQKRLGRNVLVKLHLKNKEARSYLMILMNLELILKSIREEAQIKTLSSLHKLLLSKMTSRS